MALGQGMMRCPVLVPLQSDTNSRLRALIGLQHPPDIADRGGLRDFSSLWIRYEFRGKDKGRKLALTNVWPRSNDSTASRALVF